MRYSSQDLYHIIFAIQPAKCADARDKIYGVSALVRELNDIEVDYSKSMSEVSLDMIELVPTDYHRHYRIYWKLALMLDVENTAITQALRSTWYRPGRSRECLLHTCGTVMKIEVGKKGIKVFIRPGTIRAQRTARVKFGLHQRIWDIEVGDVVSQLYPDLVMCPHGGTHYLHGPEEDDLFFFSKPTCSQHSSVLQRINSEVPISQDKLDDLNRAFSDLDFNNVTHHGRETGLLLNRIQHLQLMTCHMFRARKNNFTSFP